jgi:hypothetical protein
MITFNISSKKENKTVEKLLVIEGNSDIFSKKNLLYNGKNNTKIKTSTRPLFDLSIEKRKGKA